MQSAPRAAKGNYDCTTPVRIVRTKLPRDRRHRKGMNVAVHELYRPSARLPGQTINMKE
jgi:hypothetical protein